MLGYFTKFVWGVSTLILLTTCQPGSKPVYSFFVAGHVYGDPGRKAPGLHPPLVDDFELIRSYPGMQFGIFTGDIVYYSRDSFWNAVDFEISLLGKPVYFAVGNHDQGTKSPYTERYGPTYFHFEHGSDLFIILNPGLYGWNIKGAQLDFLKTQLAHAADYQHIFLFFHQVLWWSADNEYLQYRPNSLAGRSPTVNFWEEIMPLLTGCDRPVYCFAGDVGAHGGSPSLFSAKKGQVHLIASGMGQGVKDNYLMVRVLENNQVDIKVRWLQSLTFKDLYLP